MINDLRDTFIANIDHLDWMDTKTKTYAKEKVGPELTWLYNTTHELLLHKTACHYVTLYVNCWYTLQTFLLVTK